MLPASLRVVPRQENKTSPFIKSLYASILEKSILWVSSFSWEIFGSFLTNIVTELQLSSSSNRETISCPVAPVAPIIRALNSFTSIVFDYLFSCLGTTLKEAGSKEKQYLVDYTYQYEFAKIAAENGVPTYSLISSTGANENSPFFYPKIKGKLEQAIKKLSFKSIQIFQPPTLIRQEGLIRMGEKIGIKIE